VEADAIIEELGDLLPLLGVERHDGTRGTAPAGMHERFNPGCRRGASHPVAGPSHASSANNGRARRLVPALSR
jgi:hypothetical protein